LAENQGIVCREVAQKNDNGYVFRSENGQTLALNLEADEEAVQILGKMIWAIRSC
jgi:hypothetical protein